MSEFNLLLKQVTYNAPHYFNRLILKNDLSKSLKVVNKQIIFKSSNDFFTFFFKNRKIHTVNHMVLLNISRIFNIKLFIQNTWFYIAVSFLIFSRFTNLYIKYPIPTLFFRSLCIISLLLFFVNFGYYRTILYFWRIAYKITYTSNNPKQLVFHNCFMRKSTHNVEDLVISSVSFNKVYLIDYKLKKQMYIYSNYSYFHEPLFLSFMLQGYKINFDVEKIEKI